MVDMVFVRAVSVSDFGDGLFGIQLPVRELSSAEAKLLQQLFPHTERDVQVLLTKEALLESIVTDPVIPEKAPKESNSGIAKIKPSETPKQYRKE